MVLHCYAFDWLKNLVPLSQPIVTSSHAFSRAWRRLHVFSSSSDWFIRLSAPVVIGQSNYFGFGFTSDWLIKWREIF